MSDADCTPGREPRSVAASFDYYLALLLLEVGIGVYRGYDGHAGADAARAVTLTHVDTAMMYT